MKLSTRRLLGAAVALSTVSVVASADAALTHSYTFDNADIAGPGKTQVDKTGTANAAPAGSGANITTGLAGITGQAYGFLRDETAPINDDPANKANTLVAPAGTAPIGTAARTFVVTFDQSGTTGAETGGQQKLFGYGAGAAGQAFDVGIEAGGIRIRHFGGNILYGSGNDFLTEGAIFHQVAVRVNVGATTFANVDVFLDGNLLAVGPVGGAGTGQALNTADSAFGIGSSSINGSNPGSNGFTGSLDSFQIYDTAESNATIASLAAGFPAAVPEPTSLALLGLGGLAMLRRRRA